MGCPGGFPRLYAAASLKREIDQDAVDARRAFSAALCRGLIEARWSMPTGSGGCAGFPRLYAAASLKPTKNGMFGEPFKRFPRLYAAASLKLIQAPGYTTTGFPVFRGFMPRPH